MTYGAPPEVSGSTFSINSGDEKLSGTTENTGGYYSYKTKPIGRIHLGAQSSSANLEIKAEQLMSGSLMNLKQLRLIPVPKQTF